MIIYFHKCSNSSKYIIHNYVFENYLRVPRNRTSFEDLEIFLNFDQYHHEYFLNPTSIKYLMDVKYHKFELFE